MKKQTFHLTIDAETLAAARAQAKARDVSVAQFIREAVRERIAPGHKLAKETKP